MCIFKTIIQQYIYDKFKEKKQDFPVVYYLGQRGNAINSVYLPVCFAIAEFDKNFRKCS